MIDAAKYGPWAVIAGGSEGVGEQFALQLADIGINSVLIARKPEPLEAAAAAVRAKGVQVKTLSLDLTTPQAVAAIIDATSDLDVGLFIFNAGANTYGHEFRTGDMERFQQVIDLNITTHMRLTQHFSQRLTDRGGGGILLVGSAAGYSGSPQVSVYAAAKAFVRILTEGLWLELREHNVDVLELVLGVTRTPAMERVGLNLDAPGMVVYEPADVARMGLTSLPYGPVKIVDGMEDTVRARLAPERAELLEAVAARAKAMLPPPTK